MTAHAWPTAEEIEAARAGVFDRRWSCFDLSECQHTVNHLLDCGAWTIEVCDDCGGATATCNHKTCEWNEEGTMLRCATCGIDGT